MNPLLLLSFCWRVAFEFFRSICEERVNYNYCHCLLWPLLRCRCCRSRHRSVAVAVNICLRRCCCCRH
jgi:hypothetical protein